MMAQALEANGAVVYIMGRRKETLDKAASTAVSGLFPQCLMTPGNRQDLIKL
jgi:NADP-dependent 3-hydroxy acid dehydrogenase YdfG